MHFTLVNIRQHKCLSNGDTREKEERGTWQLSCPCFYFGLGQLTRCLSRSLTSPLVVDVAIKSSPTMPPKDEASDRGRPSSSSKPWWWWWNASCGSLRLCLTCNGEDAGKVLRERFSQSQMLFRRRRKHKIQTRRRGFCAGPRILYIYSIPDWNRKAPPRPISNTSETEEGKEKKRNENVCGWKLMTRESGSFSV